MMHYRKRIIVVITLAILIIGCAGSPKKQTTIPVAAVVPKYEAVEIPGKISINELSLWEKTLYLLPLKHPQRVELRDRIVESFAREFETIEEANLIERKKVFKAVLAVHAPSDFRVDKVAVAAVPMAKWLVDQYEKRGSESVVLAGLRFLMLAQPDNAQNTERYLELSEWSESVRKGENGDISQLNSTIEMYSKMVRLVPDRDVIEKLAKLMIKRHETIVAAFTRGMARGSRHLDPLEALIHGKIIQTLPIEIIHIFYLAGEPASARKYLEDAVERGEVRVEFLELLDRLFHKKDTADSYYTLAKYLSPLDIRSGLRACIAAREADRGDPRYSMCIGQCFEELERPEAAVDFYLEAAEVAPGEDVYSEVFELMRRSMIKIHVAEKAEAAKRMTGKADLLLGKVLAKYSDKDTELRMIAASLLFTIGEIEFDDGDVKGARRHMEESFEAMDNVRALVKMTEMDYLLGDFKSALKVIDRSKEMERGGRGLSEYWKAVIRERQADSVRALGNSSKAILLYKEAFESWGSEDIPKELVSTAAIRKGVILDRLGKTDESQEMFRKAVRLDPDRHATYAELISFLVVQGRLENAQEFYRLAYNQDQIEPMWKIYYSLWIEGLSLRLGKGSFPMTRSYLETSRGKTWQDNLARFFSDEMKIEELRAVAKNKGQLVEVEYYGAILALAKGKKAEATKMLGNVIDSNLLGFFEYRMAREILLTELNTAKK